jgi:hypothetical protein
LESSSAPQRLPLISHCRTAATAVQQTQVNFRQRRGMWSQY